MEVESSKGFLENYLLGNYGIFGFPENSQTQQTIHGTKRSTGGRPWDPSSTPPVIDLNGCLHEFVR